MGRSIKKSGDTRSNSLNATTGEQGELYGVLARDYRSEDSRYTADDLTSRTSSALRQHMAPALLASSRIREIAPSGP
jgi:hypothetical protein